MSKQEVSLKSTKDVIFAALQVANKQIEELKAKQHNPVQESIAKKEQAVLTQATAIREITVGEVIQGLKSSIGTILNGVADDLEAKLETLNVIDEAIALKQRELKEIHEIEVNANSLAALVNTRTALSDKLDTDHEIKKADYASEIEKARAELAELRNELAKEKKAWEAEFKQTQQRAESEWKYDFDRKKKQAQDKQDDELATERKEFDAEVEETKKELNEREAAVEVREATADANEAHVAELTEKVASIPTLIAEATKEAYAKGEKDAEKVTAIRISAKENELALKESALNAKNESLQEQLVAANKKAAELQEKLDAAYKDIRDMGNQMVSSKQTEAALAKFGQQTGNPTGK